MKILLIYVVIASLLAGSVLGANLYKTDPATCPVTDDVNYPGQSCSPIYICGEVGGTAQCYDTTTLTPPVATVTSSTAYNSSLNGGYVVNCYGSDAASPYCDNSGSHWCNRDASCYSDNRLTSCTGGSWYTFTCGTCVAGYTYCDGSYIDADGCEVDIDTTPYPGETNAVYDSGCNPVCDSGYQDCDADIGTGGTGCEVTTGVTSCTTGAGGPGTYSAGCVCTGVAQEHFITNTLAEGFGNYLLWGNQTNYKGWLVNLFNINGKNFSVSNESVAWADDFCVFGGDCLSEGAGGSSNISILQAENETDLVIDTVQMTNQGALKISMVTTATVNNISSTDGSDNSSWNETYARGIFDLIGAGSDNSSWNETYAKTLFADISFVDTNETTRVDALYVNITAFLNDTYYADTNETTRTDALYANVSAFLTDLYYLDTNETVRVDALYANISTFLSSGSGDNQSWNETYAKTLFADINVVDTNETTRTDALYVNVSKFLNDTYYLDTNETTKVNALYANITVFLASGAGDNSSWNETYAKTLFADISVVDTNETTRVDALYSNITVFLASGTGDNTSWNETYAKTLFADISVVDTNETTRVNALYANVSDFLVDTNTGNVSWNETYANELYARMNVENTGSFNVTGGINASLVDGFYLTGHNANEYLRIYTKSYGGGALNIPMLQGAINDSGDPDYLVGIYGTAIIFEHEGRSKINFLDDDFNEGQIMFYNSTDYVKSNYLSFESANGYIFDNHVNISTGKDVCIQGGNCLSDMGSDNSSWNETYARGIFDLIGAGSDNSSWNETYAKTLFADISFVDTNETTRVDALYTNITTFLIDTHNTSAEMIAATDGKVNSTSWNRTGTDVYLANSGDNVGIGITTPSQELTVSGDILLDGQIYFDDTSSGRIYDDGTNLIFHQNTGDLLFNVSDAGTEVLVFGGDSGVGTPASNVLLNLENNDNSILQFSSPNIRTQGIHFGDPESNQSGIISYNHFEDEMQFYTGDSLAMSILSNGNIGIGVNPSQELTVDGDILVGSYIYFEDTLGGEIHEVSDFLVINSNQAGIKLSKGDNNSLMITSEAVSFNADNTDLNFRVETLTESNMFYIDAAWETVGIGTGSPDWRLTVNDQTDVSVGVQVTNDDSGQGSGDGVVLGYSSTDYAFVWNYEETKLAFGTNGSEQMKIEANGSVYMYDVYSDVVGGTNRDLFIDDTGKLGYVSSSIRYKDNVTSLTKDDTSWIYQLNPVKFDRINSSSKNEYGLIAEEVENVNPKLVSYKREKQVECGLVKLSNNYTDSACNPLFITTNIPETVNYGSPQMTTALISEIQMLKSDLDTLEQEQALFKKELCKKDPTYVWCREIGVI